MGIVYLLLNGVHQHSKVLRPVFQLHIDDNPGGYSALASKVENLLQIAGNPNSNRDAGKRKEYSRINFCSVKPSKSLQNTLFYALVSIICGGKPLITTNKLVGPVGKKGVLGGVYRLRNA